MNRETKLSTALIVVFIATFATLLYLQSGIIPVVIIVGSMTVGFVIWLLTTARRPADPGAVLPYYLATLGFLYVHILEEYIYDFAGRVGVLFQSGWTNHDFAILLGTAGPFIWTLAAVGIWYRNALANFFVIFIFVGMIVGEPAHVLLFPTLEGGRYHYFPGMWTSLLPMVPAIAGLTTILRDHRRAAAQPA